MKQRAFIRYFDMENRARVSFQIDRGKIRRFVVQYETFRDAAWRPIIRYDTAHGFAHADLFHPKGKPTKTPLPKVGFNEAFTLAQEDINRNWERYLTRYRQEEHK